MRGGQQFITTAISLGCSPWLQRDLASCGFSKRDKLQLTSSMKDSKVTQRGGGQNIRCGRGQKTLLSCCSTNAGLFAKTKEANGARNVFNKKRQRGCSEHWSRYRPSIKSGSSRGRCRGEGSECLAQWLRGRDTDKEVVDPNLTGILYDRIDLRSPPTPPWAFDIVQTAQLQDFDAFSGSINHLQEGLGVCIAVHAEEGSSGSFIIKKKQDCNWGNTLTISALNCLHTIRSERNDVGDRTR